MRGGGGGGVHSQCGETKTEDEKLGCRCYLPGPLTYQRLPFYVGPFGVPAAPRWHPPPHTHQFVPCNLRQSAHRPRTTTYTERMTRPVPSPLAYHTPRCAVPTSVCGQRMDRISHVGEHVSPEVRRAKIASTYSDVSRRHTRNAWYVPHHCP